MFLILTFLSDRRVGGGILNNELVGYVLVVH